MGWRTKRVPRIVGLLALGALVAGCGDDGPPPPVSAAEYEEQVEALCEQHGEAFAEADQNFVDNARSDSERIAFFRTDFIPRVRTIIHALDSQGFPEGRVDEYRAVLSEVLDNAQRLRDNTPRFIDDARSGRLRDVEDYPTLIREGLAEAGINCLG